MHTGELLDLAPVAHDDPAVTGRRATTRILVRSCQRPTANLPAGESIEQMGGNQGNLLYQFATFRSLSALGNQLTALPLRRLDKGAIEATAEQINARADHLVLPLSSSFRLQMLDTLTHWAAVIERLTIPVTVVGIGAQLRLTDVAQRTYRPSRVTGVTASHAQLGAHAEAARRFVTAVLDRSTSIGVRGQVSKEYLIHLGFPADQIDVIGCPSLFMWGPDFQLPAPSHRLTRRSKISMSFDHRIGCTAPIVDSTVRDYSRSTAYAQEKLVAKMVIEGVETRPAWKGDPRFPVRLDSALYRSRRMAYLPTAWSWIDHLSQQDFSFGPRLHGTIAAILGRTPAHLLVHDSRTLELAEYHGLPYTLTSDLTPATSASDLYARTDFTRFNELYPERFATFTEFLKRNDLPHAYAGAGDTLADFDASVSAAARARTVVSNGRSAGRVRRLARHVRRGFRR